MNSTLKSLLFWVVLVVVGVLIWNFSTKFQHNEKTITFSEFISAADSGQIRSVVITGQDITGNLKSGDPFHLYVPSQYEGLANKLIDRGVQVSSKEPTASPWASLLYSWAPVLLMIGFWIFFMRQLQSGGNGALLVRQEQGEALVSSQKKIRSRTSRASTKRRKSFEIEFLKGRRSSETRRTHSEGRPLMGLRNRQDAAGPRRRGRRACRSSRSAALIS